MKITIEELLTKVRPLIKVLLRYRVLIFAVTFLGVYAYLVQHIGTLIQTEPSLSSTESEVKPVSRLKIDQNSVDQMTQLESQNIQVRTLFDNARGNPFIED